MSTFYDIAVYLIGELPQYMSFLYGIFAFILSLVFMFVVLSPFLFLFKKFSRW